MQRFLAVYTNKDGEMAAAMVSAETGDLPFGFADRTVTLIEMPDEDFRPMVVDVAADDELPLTFIDLP